MPQTLVAAALLGGGGPLSPPCAGLCGSETGRGSAHSLGHCYVQGCRGGRAAYMPLWDLGQTWSTDPHPLMAHAEGASQACLRLTASTQRQVRFPICEVGLLPWGPWGRGRTLAVQAAQSLCEAWVLGEGPVGSQGGKGFLSSQELWGAGSDLLWCLGAKGTEGTQGAGRETPERGFSFLPSRGYCPGLGGGRGGPGGSQQVVRGQWGWRLLDFHCQGALHQATGLLAPKPKQGSPVQPQAVRS